MDNFYNQIKMFQDLISGIDVDELILNRIVDMGIGSRCNDDEHFPKKEKDIDSYFKVIINEIKNIPSFDITHNDSCKLLIGIALASNYGEKARKYFHIICENNSQYDDIICEIEYSKHLRNKTTYIPIDIVYILYKNAVQSQRNLIDYYIDSKN
ncbi:hypothetical protein [uncultured Lutibacter sp.]|uniref:hypothetical protein n=1 Tax=uncultured Lutibacter sp. TaxID=437739 RepID=UPI00262753AD|nr:hypothetical protein [uncultured Lutibacter sp.]